jgi:threonine/homoserine/homoserine lactone efflux protein
MLIAALLGFVFGWLGSIPVAGPISALVVTRGIQGRQRAGVAIALGGGVGEAAYAFLAFWGFANFLSDYPIIVPVSRAAAALILTALGIAFLRGGKEEELSQLTPRESLFGSFTLGMGLCLLNPTLIATWTAVVTSLYSAEIIDFSSAQALPFALGTCAGIAGWFGTLLWLIARYKTRFKLATLARAVRWIGVALLVLAAWFGFRFVQYLLQGSA